MTRPIFEPERTYWYSVWDGPVRWSKSAWYSYTDVEFVAADMDAAEELVRQKVRCLMDANCYERHELVSVLVRGEDGETRDFTLTLGARHD